MAPICKVYKTHSSFLRRLAGLARGGADSFHSAFLRIELREETPYCSPGWKSFSLSVYKHCKNRLGNSPGSLDLIVSESCCFRFEDSLLRIQDSEVLVQIVQAVGRLPGLTSVDFSFSDLRRSDSSESLLLKVDHGADCVIDRLLPVLRESLCSQGASSELNRFQLHIKSYLRRLPAYEFLTLPGAIPSLKTLDILEIPSRHHVAGLKIPALEDDAKRIALALRASKSLISLRFSLQIQAWAEVLPALEIIAEPLMLSKIGDASGCARHKRLDGDLVLQELGLDLVLAGVPCIAHEAVKVMATVLNIAGLGFAVTNFSVSIYPVDYAFQVVMRIEHGTFVELHVPTCDEAGAAVVEEALRLNRGPSVLSLGAHPPPLVREILSPFIADQNGLQANTCVSTLILDNINYVSTVELQEGRLEEVANMMKSNSTLEHLDVRNSLGTGDYPECSRESPVVTQLQSRLRPGRNLRSFKFYGQEVQSIQCRRYLKPDRGTTHACSSCSCVTLRSLCSLKISRSFRFQMMSCKVAIMSIAEIPARVIRRVLYQYHTGISHVSPVCQPSIIHGITQKLDIVNSPALIVAGTSECSIHDVLILRSLTTLLFVVLSSDECDRGHGMRMRFRGKAGGKRSIHVEARAKLSKELASTEHSNLLRG